MVLQHPVHEFEDAWWFWDETWEVRRGPYKNEQAAYEGLQAYAAELLDDYATGKKVAPPGFAEKLKEGKEALAKICQHIEDEMRTYRNRAPAVFRKGGFGTMAFLFAARNPYTGEDFDDVKTLVWLPRNGKVDAELLQEIRFPDA